MIFPNLTMPEAVLLSVIALIAAVIYVLSHLDS
jgi:hypothetical protein